MVVLLLLLSSPLLSSPLLSSPLLSSSLSLMHAFLSFCLMSSHPPSLPRRLKTLEISEPLLTSLQQDRTNTYILFFLHTRHLLSKSRLHSSLSTLSISPYLFPHHLAATSSEEGCGESIWRIPADQNQRCLAAGSPLHGTALPK